MYVSSFRHTQVITSRKFLLKQTWRLTEAIAGIKSDTEQTINLEYLYKADFEWELNSQPDSSVS